MPFWWCPDARRWCSSAEGCDVEGRRPETPLGRMAPSSCNCVSSVLDAIGLSGRLGGGRTIEARRLHGPSSALEDGGGGGCNGPWAAEGSKKSDATALDGRLA